jgi:hypothetical protein
MNLLEIAEKAGLAVGYSQHLATTDELQRFADLVLEAAADECDGLANHQNASPGECAMAVRALKGGK